MKHADTFTGFTTKSGERFDQLKKFKFRSVVANRREVLVKRKTIRGVGCEVEGFSEISEVLRSRSLSQS